MFKGTKPQLKNYRWKGLDSRNGKCSGNLLALTEQEARQHLNQKNIRLFRLKSNPPSLLVRLSQRCNNKDITLLTRQMATMLETGIPLTQALQLVSSHQTKAEMTSILTHLRTQIEGGHSLSQALNTTSPVFHGLYVDLISAGEQSGHLAHAFLRLALYREKSDILKSKVIKALIYPSIILITALIVSYLMLTQVIPQFESMFSGFNAELPWFTRKVLTLSDWVQNYSLFIMLVTLTLTSVFYSWQKRSQAVQLRLHKFALQLPIIGIILSKAAIAKFSRTLATNVAAGIPLISSLNSASHTAGNLFYQTNISKICQETATGVPIYIAMKNTQAFPDTVVQMVMIGEESGQLDDMLNKIATMYESDVDHSVDNLGQMLEPLIIVLLGGLIGGLVIAMYLPIFNLMSVIG
ncbi:type II secretion system protein F [Vibrio sp. 10N.286.49.B3]|uniref:type II secretion system F family protein n=1 Tax=Vibrio sp. 10N.286.49.B3 TaxID=1880855 RepID=UPI000C847223|nr:type II secretion system F family protein [Vibrio sp. 10N.286.49.B3]PMH41296.1 type II secretion system protein F [Vibrio sp. 10N.286.49.B3]